MQVQVRIDAPDQETAEQAATEMGLEVTNVKQKRQRRDTDQPGVLLYGTKEVA